MRKPNSFWAPKFFHPLPLYRPFSSIAEQNTWMGRSATPGLQPFIERISTQSEFNGQVNDPFGGIVLRHCGYLDVNSFMEAVRSLGRKQNWYFDEPFSFEDLEQTDEISYRHLLARTIVFCEGTHVQNNPYFRWLPIHSLKGETLEILPVISPKLIFNKGVYIVPGEEGRYKVGATYQRNAMGGISEEGRTELTSKLDELVRFGYQVIHQNWGYRPTIIDRKPVLGPHPQFPKLVVFNGLGTKGVSLAPHFSGVLAEWLIRWYPN